MISPRALLTALLSSVLLAGTGCPKEATTTTSGTTSTSPDTASSASQSGNKSSQDAPAEPMVAEDGRRQQVDAYGNPLFNPDGSPIWEPTAREKAVQLFEEALILGKGIGGSPPNYVGAMTRLRDALAFNEDFPEAHYNLGLVQLEMGALRDARLSFESALKYKADMRDALLALGISSERLGELGSAMTTYMQGMALDKEDVDFLNGVARVLRKQGKATQARDRARAILEINANSLEAYNTLGLAYLDLGEIELARFVFIKAEASVPGGDLNASIQANLGLVFFKKEDEFEAEARFVRAMALDPDHVGASVNLAYIKLQNYDFEGARLLLEKAHQRVPGNVPIALDLAVAYSGSGELKKAEELYDEIANSPGEFQASATYNLGILYADKLKDLDAAVAQYNKYISLVESTGEPIAEDDPVFSYIAEVEKAKKREERRRNREAKKRAKAEAKARKAEEAAREAAAAQPPADPEATENSNSGEPEGGTEGPDNPEGGAN